MKKTTFETGRLAGADGQVRNKVDIYKQAGSAAQPVGNSRLNPTQFPPRSSLITGEDGKNYDELELIGGMAENYMPNEGNTKAALDFDLKRKSIDLEDNAGAYVSVHDGMVNIATDEQHFKTALLNGEAIATRQDIHDAGEGMASEDYVDNAISESIEWTVQNITQADYDDLTQAEKTCGTMYFTTDTHKLYKNGYEYTGVGKTYKETVLYSGGTTATVGTVQLSQPITDFDAVTFVFGKPDGSGYVKNMYTYPSSTIPNGWMPEYGPIGLYVEADDVTFGWNNGNQMYPWKVIGISYGGSVTADSALDTTSENPVQNKVVAAAINSLIARVAALEGNV